MTANIERAEPLRHATRRATGASGSQFRLAQSACRSPLPAAPAQLVLEPLLPLPSSPPALQYMVDGSIARLGLRCNHMRTSWRSEPKTASCLVWLYNPTRSKIIGPEIGGPSTGSASSTPLGNDTNGARGGRALSRGLRPLLLCCRRQWIWRRDLRFRSLHLWNSALGLAPGTRGLL